MSKDTATREDDRKTGRQGDEGEERPEDDGAGREEGLEARRQGYVPKWEWAVGIVGLVLVVGTIGFLLYRAVTVGSTPPDIAIRVASITQSGSGYLVEIVVNNSGDETAAMLEIEGELKDGTEVVETSTVVIDYAPTQSSRKAGLYFTEDPRAYELSLRAVGYQTP
jgi:uncharacterized protein (TIGR02588 family)